MVYSDDNQTNGWGYGATEQPLSADVMVGSDIMVATPAGQELQNTIAELEGQQTTFTAEDLAALQARVETIVKTMMAQGYPDDKILAEVKNLAPNMEMAAVAEQVAQQQLDADKFNMFSTRNQEAGQSADTGLGTAAGFVLGGAALAAGAGTFRLDSEQLATVQECQACLLGNNIGNVQEASVAMLGELAPPQVGQGMQRGAAMGLA